MITLDHRPHRRPRGDETAFGRLVAPHRAGAARPLLPDARLGARRRGRAAGRAAARLARARQASRAAARCARGSTASPPTSACARSSGAARAASSPRTRAPGEGEVRWLEPFPDAELRDERADAGGALRGARERRARVRRRAPAPLPAPARGAAAARRARLRARGDRRRRCDASPAAVYSALQRAHATVEEKAPERSQQATLRSLGDGRRARAGRALRARRGRTADVARAAVALLTDDATFAMPPLPQWYRGREAIGAFLARGTVRRGRAGDSSPRSLNGQLVVHVPGAGRHAARGRRARPRARRADRGDHGVPGAAGRH